MNRNHVERLLLELIQELGESPKRDGLQRTPRRLAAALDFLTSGYQMNLDSIVNEARFRTSASNMVIVRDIELYSLCEHHMLPFFGRCHIGYIPDGQLLGVSKFPRIVDMFARRLQIQETLTEQIAQSVCDVIRPQGVGVVVEARHLCMMMRGVEKQNSLMVTSSVLGSFRDSVSTRAEFMSLIRVREGIGAP